MSNHTVKSEIKDNAEFYTLKLSFFTRILGLYLENVLAWLLPGRAVPVNPPVLLRPVRSVPVYHC